MLDAKLVAAGSVALAVTMIAIFSLRPMARRLGLIDRSDERKRHRGRVPMIGGLSFFIGTIAGLACFGVLDSFVICLLVTGAVIMLIGLIDDMYDLSAASRMTIQAGVAIVVIVATGVHVDSLGFFGASELRTHTLGIPLTIVAVVGLINAFNMMDGIDGLAGGLAVVCILAILAFSTAASGQALGVLLLLQVLLVAMVPYIGVNLGWPDGRKIFMGDAGSTLIGFLLAWSLIFLSRREVAMLAPVDVLWCIAVPIMDTLAVIVRRMSQGRSPFKADRQHLHHLMLDAGYSPRAVLALIVGAGALLAAIGYAMRNVPHPINFTIFGGLMALYVTQLHRGLGRLQGISRNTRNTPIESGAPDYSFDEILFEGALPTGLEAADEHRHAPLKALCVLGDSPDLVKVALVARKLLLDRRFDTHVCVTDLTSDTRRKILGLFDIRSDIQLDVGQAGADATDIASATLNGMKQVLSGLRPDVVIVHGDTSAALAATLAACYQQIPVARIDSVAATIDAPARSSGAQINRRLASALASLHLTPTESAGRELVAAGVPRERITVTGDPAIETLRTAVERIRRDDALHQEMAHRFAFLRPDSPLLLVTHRERIAEFAQLGRALRSVARRRPDVDIIYPIAMTPDAYRATHLLGWRPANMHLVEPLDFLAFAYLLQSAYLVLTTSSEVENEAATLGKRVLLLRDSTEGEREGGRVNLHVAADHSAITDGVVTLLDDNTAYDATRFGNEDNAEYDACFRIVDALASVSAKSSALAA